MKEVDNKVETVEAKLDALKVRDEGVRCITACLEELDDAFTRRNIKARHEGWSSTLVAPCSLGMTFAADIHMKTV